MTWQQLGISSNLEDPSSIVYEPDKQVDYLKQDRDEMNIAIIPARGGSKRIPRKNIREFCGKPMIAWSIEAARAADCFDRVIVSTEDSEIATEMEVTVPGKYALKVR